ncbi:hypothetical protein GCK72_015967 [Caenorhabditis remanei]|uniref:Uncharacterized protein n=1 Tax=Caenorhabditis remanei TaxID=31234 RepID=A0A6A5GVH3_CAERE|nr:hypothetical protein GCK72_015967 [Caenorhabditis remanei]KAF1759500.1 hypothetical protein GCK72_015967 [Caenorhabditis remanei]
MFHSRTPIYDIILIIFTFLACSDIFYEYYWKQEEVHGQYQTDLLSNFMDYCALATYDPWDPKIVPYLWGEDPTKNCDRKWRPYTELVNGTWRVVKKKEGVECKARCYYSIDFNGPLNRTDWFPPGPVDCEFLEAACWENGYEVYGYIHTQIIAKPVEKKKNEHKPNVLVYLIDSMSVGMAQRSLPKTLKFLKTRFKTVEFPFMSQVGLNSKPNGMPLWFGKQIEPGKLKGGADIKVDWNETEFCQSYLDGEQHLFKDFMEHGYKTLHSEDWSYQTVSSFPDCKGFKNQYTDHTFVPFNKIHEFDGLTVTKGHLKGRSLCREIYHAAIDQFEQFTEVYSDQPKLSWIWNIRVAHDEISGLDRLDAPLLDFFKKHEEEFDDYFIFLMSDHGFRRAHYHMYDTENGAMEKHNPYLSISVPKKYRNPEILKIMQKNAKELQTQYDTRATLLDIVKFQPASQFSNRTLLEIPNEKGHSLIRHQPSTPRTCGRLPIPQQYCICRTATKDMREDTALTNRLATQLIAHVYQKLDKFNLTSLCHEYEIDYVSHLDLYPTTNINTSTYRIAVKTKPPIFAHFETLVTEDNKTKKLEFEEVERLDTYGNTADCTNRIHSNRLCFCKDWQV